MLLDLITNRVFVTVLIAWFLGQALKVPIEYLVKRRWNWALWFGSGGMPSSHSSLIVATTLSIGLFYGFGTPVFALAFAISMIIVYDAAGVRRQAGFHAEKINLLFEELFSGKPIPQARLQERLKEVIGHTPNEVIGGIALGVIVALSVYFIWPMK
jgi:acid phosphatase family membrane protein YuiD